VANTLDFSKIDRDAYAERLIKIKDEFAESRKKRERQWYINENFDRGFHFVWWKASTRTIDTVSPPKGLALRCVPKTSRQGEAIISQICGAPMTVTVQPLGESDESIDDAKNITNWLRQKEVDLNLQTDIFPEVAHGAFKTGFGLAEVGFDPDINDIYVQEWDSFDTYLPLNIKRLPQTPVLVKAVFKRLDEIRDNPNYSDTEDLKAEPVWSGSEMKESLTNERLGNAPSSEGFEGAIVYEFQILVKRDKGKLEEGRSPIGVMIVSVCGKKVIGVAEPEETELESLPWALLKFKPGTLDATSWIERFISTNKSFDILVSNIENFAQLFWKGRIWKQKGTTITPKLSSLMGAIYEYEGMAPPKTEDLPTLPAALFTHIANQERWMEEQGLSSIFSGRVPRGVRAAKMMESMKQADMSNLGVPLLYYQAFLTELYEKMIECAAANYDEVKTFVGPSGNTESEENGTFKVIGEDVAKYAAEGELDDVTVIKRSYKVKIELQPQMGFTQEGRLETIKEMMPVLTQAPEPIQRLVLKELGVSNISEFISGLKMGNKTSILDTPEFNLILKSQPTLAKTILAFLQTPEAQGQNPLSFIDGNAQSLKAGAVGREGSPEMPQGEAAPPQPIEGSL